MENGEFQNVIYVPNLSSNLLSIYQIIHLGDGHRVEFLPDSVQVHCLKENSLVVVRKVNDNKRLYSFSHFVPKSPSKALLHQSNSNIKLSHEQYGYLAFRYLQKLNTSKIVKGLPQINFSHGECFGYPSRREVIMEVFKSIRCSTDGSHGIIKTFCRDYIQPRSLYTYLC